ncbi:MAG: sugar phosphate isomerase/epimerase [Clostridia bacterium]|nr:sugar phosphate isomerase/epimerase [Clostridia bacterium]
MKLSVELYTLAQRFGDFRAIEISKAAGFDAIDYSYYYDKECEEVLGDGYKEYAEKLRVHLDKVGIACNQAHAPFSLKYGLERNIFEEKYLWMIHALESASILGAENIVVHSITVPDGVDFEKYNIEYYKSFIPYCEQFGIHVAVENLFSRDKKRKRLIGKLGSPAELNSIVEKINSPWIVACVDIGHAALTGYEPEKFIEAVNPGILKSLHVQDNDYLGDKHILPYTGELNWEAIMHSLKKAGYTGDLTFEIIKFLDKFPDELFPEVMRFAVSVGKHLVSLYNK